MSSAVDPLLECLLALCRFHGAGTTAAALCGGLPLKNGQLTPDLFDRAASRMGLSSKFVHRDVDAVDKAIQPMKYADLSCHNSDAYPAKQ